MVKVRGVAIDAANDYQAFDVAHRLVEALLAMRSLDHDTKTQLRERDLQPLNNILAQVASPRRSPVTTDSNRKVQTNAPAYSPQTTTRSKASWFWRLAGVLIVLVIGKSIIGDSQADVPSSSSRSKPIAAPTSQMPSLSNCSGLDPWWDDSLGRMEEYIGLYNSVGPYTSNSGLRNVTIQLGSISD